MHRWEDNTRMDFREININTRNCVDSTQDRDYWRALVNAELNPRVPYLIELFKTLYPGNISEETLVQVLVLQNFSPISRFHYNPSRGPILYSEDHGVI
jgi:hypothetical protein